MLKENAKGLFNELAQAIDGSHVMSVSMDTALEWKNNPPANNTSPFQTLLEAAIEDFAENDEKESYILIRIWK